MSSSKNSPDVCTRCAESPPTCCVLSEVEKELCFPIFPDEQKQLEQATPARTSDQPGCEPPFVKSPNTPELIQAMLRLFPGEEDAIRELFPDGGEHVRLGTDADGYCVFLGDSGCVFSPGKRPAHCRLFPMWVDGNKPRYLDAQCLAIEEARGMAMLYRLLDTDPACVRAAYQELRRFWGLPPMEEDDLEENGGDAVEAP